MSVWCCPGCGGSVGNVFQNIVIAIFLFILLLFRKLLFMAGASVGNLGKCYRLRLLDLITSACITPCLTHWISPLVLLARYFTVSYTLDQQNILNILVKYIESLAILARHTLDHQYFWNILVS